MRAYSPKNLPRFVVEEGPPLIVALFVAEAFFKWGSFMLECLGFLAVWYAASWPYGLLLAAVRRIPRSRMSVGS